MERAFEQYITELDAEISALVYANEGSTFEEKFTEYTIEILDSIGKTEGAVVVSYIHPNESGQIDWKINGYCLRDSFQEYQGKEYFETLDLFITVYKNGEFNFSFNKSDFEKTVSQVKKFINGALKNHIDYIEKSNKELVEFIEIVGNQNSLFDRVTINILTNGTSKGDYNKSVKISGYSDLIIGVEIWDLERLFRINEVNAVREPIKIELGDFLKKEIIGLEALEIPDDGSGYQCFLSIVPGYLLADLYKKFSSELLESNVRAFLGQTGKFNKGIRDTIRENPKMFLPYNNGVTATAQEVKTTYQNGKLYIQSLEDFQIVNGGQTTASLFHTRKKYPSEVDLDKVNIQMKLTVIKDPEIKNIEVPLIARYANSQNKVSELDLSSNNPFFVEIEKLSRRNYVLNIDNPRQQVLWFFERVKGQYKESLNRRTPAQQRKFKELNPYRCKFLKSDISKFMHVWEQKPYFVSRGSQKNFIEYTKSINLRIEKNDLPGDNFYKKLIANAILFQNTDKLFGRKNIDAIGDTMLKSFTVAYGLSYFHYITDNRIDLESIYNTQEVNKDVLLVLSDIIKEVYDYLTRESPGLVSEFAKRETTWKALKDRSIKIDLRRISLLSEEEKTKLDFEKTEEELSLQDEIRLKNYVYQLGIKFWDGFRIYVEKQDSSIEKLDAIEDLLKKIKNNKPLTSRNVNLAKRTEAVLQNDPTKHELFLSLSPLEVKNKEVLNIENAYKKLISISPENWKRILALGEQQKIFEYKELAMLKSINRKIRNKESIQENLLVAANKSLEKVKKFGLY